MTKKQRNHCLYIASHFVVDDKPLNEIITDSQLEMLFSLIFRNDKRLQIICSTQYGKSMIVAIACVWIACMQGEVIAVVAPTGEKAKIIMRYFVEHLGDHERFENKLEQDTRLERLKQEGSKDRIILRNGGGIFVVSTNERNSQKSIESAMGFGAKIVIGDEYCLVNDDNEATIYRMIAGKGPDAFYCKIGNPFYVNSPYTHFKKTWDGNKYKKIFIDYNIGIKEGRYTADFIEEAKTRPMFDILYECQFPPEDIQDDKGFRPLVVSEEIKRGTSKEAIKRLIDEEIMLRGELSEPVKLGVDISGGGDDAPYTIRWKEHAVCVDNLKTEDTMQHVNKVEEIMEMYHVEEEDVNIDDIGVGRGVVDRLHEKEIMVNGVTAGEKATDEQFANLKAQLCWEARNWVKGEFNKFDDEEGYIQLTWLKYKVNSDKKIIIEPKDQLKKRTHNQSPDYAESFYLTFYEPVFEGFI